MRGYRFEVGKTRKKHRNLSISMLFLVREAGLEFQESGIYGVF